MADVKISQLPAATTPVDGTEVLPIVQSATTKQVSIANLTAGRALAASSLTLTTPLAVTSGGTGLATVAQGALLSATAADTISATRTPTLGLAGTAAGTLGLSGSTSGVVTLQTAAAAGTWSMTLPTSGGTNGYILTTNGAGVTTWTNPTALGVDLDVGTTAITGGTSGRVLYNNAGVLGEYTITGTGSVVLGTSPTFTTSAIFPAGTVGAPGITTTGDTNTGIYFPAADTIGFVEGGTESMRLDAAGNLGLGVTPSAWTLGKAFQVLGASILSEGDNVYLTSNGYYGSLAWTYRANNYASQYYQLNGAHVWRTAASGTAGSAISFTQAMTLTSGGYLLVGDTSSFGAISVQAYAKSNASFALGTISAQSGDVAQPVYFISKFDNNNTTSAKYAVFYYNNAGSVGGYITGNGSGNLQFTASSDARLKENIVDVEGQLDNILSLKPRKFDFIKGQKNCIGFIAQEIESVYPDVIGEDENGYKTVGGISVMETRIIKAIQELSAKVTALEAANG